MNVPAGAKIRLYRSFVRNNLKNRKNNETPIDSLMGFNKQKTDLHRFANPFLAISGLDF